MLPFLYDESCFNNLQNELITSFYTKYVYMNFLDPQIPFFFFFFFFLLTIKGETFRTILYCLQPTENKPKTEMII